MEEEKRKKNLSKYLQVGGEAGEAALRSVGTRKVGLVEGEACWRLQWGGLCTHDRDEWKKKTYWVVPGTVSGWQARVYPRGL
jgi:hypothetical protein